MFDQAMTDDMKLYVGRMRVLCGLLSSPSRRHELLVDIKKDVVSLESPLLEDALEWFLRSPDQTVDPRCVAIKFLRTSLPSRFTSDDTISRVFRWHNLWAASLKNLSITDTRLVQLLNVDDNEMTAEDCKKIVFEMISDHQLKAKIVAPPFSETYEVRFLDCKKLHSRKDGINEMSMEMLPVKNHRSPFLNHPTTKGTCSIESRLSNSDQLSAQCTENTKQPGPPCEAAKTVAVCKTSGIITNGNEEYEPAPRVSATAITPLPMQDIGSMNTPIESVEPPQPLTLAEPLIIHVARSEPSCKAVSRPEVHSSLTNPATSRQIANGSEEQRLASVAPVAANPSTPVRHSAPMKTQPESMKAAHPSKLVEPLITREKEYELSFKLVSPPVIHTSLIDSVTSGDLANGNEKHGPESAPDAPVTVIRSTPVQNSGSMKTLRESVMASHEPLNIAATMTIQGKESETSSQVTVLPDPLGKTTATLKQVNSNEQRSYPILNTHPQHPSESKSDQAPSSLLQTDPSGATSRENSTHHRPSDESFTIQSKTPVYKFSARPPKAVEMQCNGILKSPGLNTMSEKLKHPFPKQRRLKRKQAPENNFVDSGMPSQRGQKSLRAIKSDHKEGVSSGHLKLSLNLKHVVIESEVLKHLHQNSANGE